MPPPTSTPSISTNANQTFLHQQYQRGLNYYHGTNSFTQNKQKAFEIFKKCALERHAKSMLELGCMYFLGEHHTTTHQNGDGQKKPDFRKAMDWWNAEELQNDREALYGIGMVHHIEGRRDLAEKYLQRSSDMDYQTATDVLNQYYRKLPEKVPDNTREQDSEASISLFESQFVPQSLVLGETRELLKRTSDSQERIASLEKHLSTSQQKNHIEIKAELTEIQRMLRKQQSELDDLKRAVNKRRDHVPHEDSASKTNSSPTSFGLSSQSQSIVNPRSPSGGVSSTQLAKTIYNAQQSVTSASVQMEQSHGNLLKHIKGNHQEIQTLKEEFQQHKDEVRNEFGKLTSMLEGLVSLVQQQKESQSFPALSSNTGKRKLKASNSKSSTREFQLGQRNSDNALPPLETLKQRSFSSMDVQKELSSFEKDRKRSKKKRR